MIQNGAFPWVLGKAFSRGFSCEKSWEDAGRAAVETAAGTLRDLRVAEVTQMDMKLENGKVSAFRTRVSLSFKYEA